jgi:hypothetical protein
MHSAGYSPRPRRHNSLSFEALIGGAGAIALAVIFGYLTFAPASVQLQHPAAIPAPAAASVPAQVNAAADVSVYRHLESVQARQEVAAARSAAIAREAAHRAAVKRTLMAARRQAAAIVQQPAAPAAAPAYSAVYSYAGIEALWVAAGGPAWAEATAACIAEAESGGRAGATHTDASGQVDYGLFQIGNDPAALNPAVAAQTAVRMSSGGTDWSAWTTSGNC